MKKLFKLLVTTTLALSVLTGCGSSSNDDSSNNSSDSNDNQASSSSSNSDSSSSSELDKLLSDYKIGVIQYMEHDALDFAREGFIQELVDYGFDPNSIEVQNAQGEASNCATIATKFVNDEVDLILAIATKSAQSVVQATSTIPIVGTCITDYESAGLTTDNITGTSNMNPAINQLNLIQAVMPDVSKVGIMYCSSEDNSVYQVSGLVEVLDNAGIEIKEFTVSDSNEVAQVAQNAVNQVELIYIPNDNLLAQTIATVGLIAGEAGIPVVCGDATMAANGGLIAYSLDYTKLGAQTAKQAIRILEDGEDISTMPIEYVSGSDLGLYVNEEMFEKIGLEIPDAFK
ncbi:MAG: ABC transporter substrate-binding protein [bacterium]